MEIAEPCVVALTWRLEDAHGGLIDERLDPFEFFFGGDDLLPAVQAALAGQRVGYATRLQLEPEDAFGDYDASLVFFENRALFGEPVEPGVRFDGPPPGATTPGLRDDAVYTVTEVYPDHVVLDGNHPLAGIALRLALTVRAVREASADEIDAASAGEPVFSVLNAPPPGSALH